MYTHSLVSYKFGATNLYERPPTRGGGWWCAGLSGSMLARLRAGTTLSANSGQRAAVREKLSVNNSRDIMAPFCEPGFASVDSRAAVSGRCPGLS